jgi:hypothetical protein
MHDIASCLLLMPVDADHPFVPQYIVQSPYLGAVLWKRWGLGGGDMAGTYGVLSGIQAAIQEARARRSKLPVRLCIILGFKLTVRLTCRKQTTNN